MTSWRPLVRALLFRHLAAHRLRTALTVAGVALGVAVVVAVDAASRVALDAFTETAGAIAGSSAARVRRDGLPLEESALETLAPLWRVARLRPVLVERGRVGGPEGESFEVIGLNLLADPVLEAAERMGGGERATGPSGARERDGLFPPEGAFVGRRFAERLGFAAGDTIRLHSGARVVPLRVAAVAEDDGLFRAYSGNTAVLDIAAFQALFGRAGTLSWIDLVPRPGADPESLLAAARALAPRGVLVERPAEGAERVRGMVSAYRMNLLALGGVAALVGVFLVANTVSASVLARREEIALLRALGAGRPQVAALLAGEAAAIGLIGSAAGLLLAHLLARGAVGLVTATIYRSYGALRAESPTIDGLSALLALFFGVVLSLAASLAPLARAARIRPLEFLREHRPARAPRWGRRGIVGAASLAGAGLSASAPPFGNAPLFGYLSAFLLMVGVSALLPFLLAGAAAACARISRRAGWAPARIAGASLASTSGRHAAGAASLAVALGLVVGMAILVASFDRTVLDWAAQTLRADLWVEPQARTGGTLEGTLPPEVADRIAALPFVAAVDRFRGLELVVEGSPALLGAGEARVLAERGRFPVLGGLDAEAALAGLAGADRVLVSEPFARRRGTRTGDTVRLPTRGGETPFLVAGVYRDYASDRGYVVMDRETFLRHFGETALSTIAVYLSPGSDPDAAAAAIDRAAGSERVRVRTTATLRREIERTLRSTFALTYALTAIALAVALLAVAATLGVVVVEERRTIGVLRALGASGRQVAAMIGAQALLLGVAGAAAGAAIGFLLGVVLVFVINRQSFGWSLAYTVPWRGLAILLASIPAVALASGLAPARRAARIPPREAMARD